MQRAWVVLLAGCGFNAATATSDAAIDTSMSTESTAVMMCGRIENATYDVHWLGCTTTTLAPLHITANSSVDTNAGSSSGPTCTIIHVDVTTAGKTERHDICALVASTITIDAGVTLSAHGGKPLALFAHEIDIEGTIDVASHKTVRGPGALDSCNPSTTLAKGAGGGAGGTYDGAGGGDGGAGGNQGGVPTTGGPAGTSVSISQPGAGCDGRRGGDGTTSGGANGVGGAGGGTVWIASDMGMLKLGSTAVINASGAGGAGGAMTNHGGGGGGSGGLIILQSSAFMRDPGAQIFANGGHGGGGAIGVVPGTDGSDPTGPASGGGGGAGGSMTSLVSAGGDGGTGFPSLSRQGQPGDTTLMAGGGGGGGGAGAIRIVSAASFDSGNVSPPAVQWTPAP
jgi:hypothetical protein